MSGKRINVRGIDVDIWKTSIKVQGMDGLVFFGRAVSESEIEDLINALYARMVDQAEKEGKERLSRALIKLMDSV